MSDANGWPDATRPGVPLNPEKLARHWLESASGGTLEPCFWHPTLHFWDAFGTPRSPKEIMREGWRYLGPCLTPSEVTQRTQAASAAAWMAAREAGAEAARCVPIPEEASASEAHGRISAALEACMRIRALPPPADAAAALDALAAAGRLVPGWQPFDHKNPPEGHCWLEVERPETWSDSDETGRDIGGYTGKTHRIIALAFVYRGNDGPEFDRVEGSDFPDVEAEDAVLRFMPLTAPRAEDQA